MWKKLNEDVGAQPEFAANQALESESLDDTQVEPLIDSRFEKWNFPPASEKTNSEGNHQATSPAINSSPSMTAYTEALNEFAKSATAFIEQLPLLTKAREAYERAMKTSAELRKVLDTGEENLQTLMAQLEQAVNVHGVKPAADRKRPELAKVEAIRGGDETNSGLKRMP